ncbi:MAG: crcB [Clostridia bacterium]|nr:crcB [Clostridia bacterium]
MALFLVGIGGMLGSLTRYSAGRLINRHIKSAFPYATFIINIVGAFMLGIVSARLSSGELYLLAGEGFLGAFTTFSTFMYEGFDLIKNNKYLNAALYVTATFVLGVIGFGAGYYCF